MYCEKYLSKISLQNISPKYLSKISLQNISPKYLSKISLLISVVLILIVVVSCAPQMTDEELEAELAKLTPEEREELLADLESKESGALAGQAYSAAVAKYKLPAKVATVSKAKVVLIAKKITLPTQCPNKCFVKVHLEPINNIDVSTKYFIEGSQYFYVGQESYWNWHISNCKEIDFGESVPVGPQGAGGIVREIYGCYKKQICGPEQEGTLSEDTGMIPCPYGCSNGACLPETTTKLNPEAAKVIAQK